MNYFATNLLLAFIWAALRGVDLGNLALGFLLGFLILTFGQPFVGSGGYVRAVLAALHLALVFLFELVTANLRLARDVLRIRLPFQPAFLRVDVPELSANQVAVLAALVSLTPGTLTIDVVGEAVVVHTVYAHDPEAARRSVRRMAELIRRCGGGPAPVARQETPS